MRFLRWIVFIWLLFSIPICMVKWRGQNSEDKLSEFGLGVCEGKPCYRGIVPGLTQWQDVHTYLKADNIWSDKDIEIGIMLTDTIAVDLFRDDDVPVVTRINVSDYTPVEFTPTIFPSVGDFILKFGTPCWVILDNHVQGEHHLRVASLVYPTMSVHVATGGSLIPSALVGLVQIIQDDMTEERHDLCANEQNVYSGLTWAGFTSHHRNVKAFVDKQQARLRP